MLSIPIRDSKQGGTGGASPLSFVLILLQLRKDAPFFQEFQINSHIFLLLEVIAKLLPNRQDATSEGKERKRSVVTTLSLSGEANAP